MPHTHLLDRTLATPRMVSDNDGMAVAAKVVAVTALDGIHLDDVAERYTAVNLTDGAEEAVPVPLRRCDVRL